MYEKSVLDREIYFVELMFDLYATVRPDGSQNGYHVDLSANIPLEMEGDKPGAYDMVFGSSACLIKEG